MKLKNIVYILAALFLLTACDSLTIPYQNVLPDADLTASCEELEKLPEKANLGDVLSVGTRNNSRYNDCAARHDRLSKFITGQKT